MASKYKFVIIETDETGDEHVFEKDVTDTECEGFVLLTMCGDPDNPEMAEYNSLIHNVSVHDIFNMLRADEHTGEAAMLLTFVKAFDCMKKGANKDAAD